MSLDPVSTGYPHVAAHNEERDAINDLQDGLETKIDRPSVPQVGSMIIYNGTAWVKSVTRLFEGTGQPEGVVAAPVGSRYVDTGAAEGAVEWLKVRGVDANDNTGWMLLAGDTGWRNVSSSIDKRTNGVVNAAYIRRVNQHVDLYFDLKMPTNTASPYVIMTLPVGFRPDFMRYGALQDNNEAAVSSTSINAAGVVSLITPVAAKTDRFNGSYTTKEAWPASLPGTAL